MNKSETSKQKQGAVEQLRESENLYQLFTENSLDVILLTAPDGAIYTANPAACMMFQRTEEEICLIGRNGLVDNTDPRLHELLKQRMNLGKVQGEILMVQKRWYKIPR